MSCAGAVPEVTIECSPYLVYRNNNECSVMKSVYTCGIVKRSLVVHKMLNQLSFEARRARLSMLLYSCVGQLT